MKVFITKYALTNGIQELEAELSQTSNKMILCKSNGHSNYYHKPFWHEKRDDAVIHANKLRENKIKALKNQLLKLEKPFT